MSDIVGGYGNTFSMMCTQNNGEMCFPKYMQLTSNGDNMFGSLQPAGDGQGVSAEAVNSVFMTLLAHTHPRGCVPSRKNT